MAKNRSVEVFLDTGIFVAWLVAADRQHQAASELFESLSQPITTSLAVIAEAYSLFLHRFGEDASRSFRVALAALPKLSLCGLDSGHHRAVEKKLDALRGMKLTYVDASSLVLVAERRIRTVWGTDNDLAIEGAAVIPGPA
jgi:predicted nucleic acid-binding protein